jgi:uncharacterized C2H2 Zn-finger protein
MATEKIVKRVKLWNRGSEDYKQLVRGDEVFIPKSGYIECGRRRAIEIRGHCTGKHVRAKLEIEPIFEKGNVNEIYVDHKTGQQFPTRDALLKHLGIDPASISADRAVNKYLCPLCDATFDNKEDVVTHMGKCMDKTQGKSKKQAG